MIIKPNHLNTIIKSLKLSLIDIKGQRMMIDIFLSPETYHQEMFILDQEERRIKYLINLAEIEQEISKHELEAEKLRNKLKGMTND